MTLILKLDSYSKNASVISLCISQPIQLYAERCSDSAEISRGALTRKLPESERYMVSSQLVLFIYMTMTHLTGQESHQQAILACLLLTAQSQMNPLTIKIKLFGFRKLSHGPLEIGLMCRYPSCARREVVTGARGVVAALAVVPPSDHDFLSLSYLTSCLLRLFEPSRWQQD